MFNATIANIFAHILVIGVFFLSITAFLSGAIWNATPSPPSNPVLQVAHAVAVVMILLYFCYFCFYSTTHRYLLEEEGDYSESVEPSTEPLGLRPATIGFLLVLSIALLVICARYALLSLGAFANSTHIPESFVIFFFLPILNHPSDIFLCMRVAWNGRSDLYIRLVLESSVGTISFLNPLFVLMGWAIGQPLAVDYTGIQLVPLFLAAVIVSSYGFADGRSNWFLGSMLLAL
jgi:Ca2+:H+ antiporter